MSHSAAQQSCSAFEKKRGKKSGSDNMKQNLETILNLHFWLSMKAAGGVPETTATSCIWRFGGEHLPPRQETQIRLLEDPPDRCSVAWLHNATLQVRSSLLELKSFFRRKVGSTGSLSGGWTNDTIGCTCNHRSKWLPWLPPMPCVRCRWKVGVVLRRGGDPPVNLEF